MTQAADTTEPRTLSNANKRNLEQLSRLHRAAKPATWGKAASEAQPGGSFAAVFLTLAELQIEISELERTRTRLVNERRILLAKHAAARSVAARFVFEDAETRQQTTHILRNAQRAAREQGDKRASRKISEALCLVRRKPSQIRDMYHGAYESTFEG